MSKYFLLIFEYAFIKRWKIFLRLIPALLVGISILYCDLKLSENDITTYISNSINVLGILFGFTSSIFAIIITSETESFKSAKETVTDRKFYKKPFTIFDQIIINTGFLIFLLGILLVINFLIPIYKNILGIHYLKVFAGNIRACLNFI
ncbi:MAG: hypothetical protein Q4G16_09680 [Cruoricaptor ignavus]|nr:hypothetical protein [Cruoricaptor ignavus]